MARGINKVILVGNLGQDPEVRHMPQGGAVATLNLATSESWNDKNTGEKKEQTEWHRVVVYQRLAEIAGEYLRKGSKVYVEGKLKTRKWQDDQGVERYTTEIVANELQMLDSQRQDGGMAQPAPQQAPAKNYQRPQGAQQPAQQAPAYQAPAQQQAPAYQPPPQQGYGGMPTPPVDFDDDIPF